VLKKALGDRSVGAVGLGCAPMSLRPNPDDEGCLATLLAALEAGVTLFDTADVYNPPGEGAGHSERLVRTALSSWSGNTDEVVVATKGGKYWSPGGEVIIDGRPGHLRDACHESLRRLGVEAIPLYFFHEPDPGVPYAESIGELANLKREGKIRLVGVSNVSLEQLEVARTTVEVAAVQNQYSPVSRSSRPQLARCAELNIAFLPWGPLGGIGGEDNVGPVAERFALLAGKLGVSAHRLAIAWALAQSPVVIPIPGATRPQTLLDDVMALSLQLEDGDLAWLDGGGMASL
jgi:aryl-alcohol dehydrogenase-like predicted oxidoreductase